MAVARFLLNRLKNATPNTCCLFSSSSAVIQLPWTDDVSEDSGGKKSVCKRALELQRPTTVKVNYWGIRKNFWSDANGWEIRNNCVKNADDLKTMKNFVSFIGVIDLPLKACKSRSFSDFGVCTLLRVKSRDGGRNYFRIMLKFWDEIAEMSVQHLKPLDTIYVSGSLNSYLKVDNTGKLMQYFEVVVKEVDFVAQPGALSACQDNHVELKPEVSYEEKQQRRIDRLHLWHVFFASPYEWWDNRKSKRNPKSPDFKHKDTGEVLWLYDSDPPWVRQQLQLQDSRLGNPSQDGRNARPRLSQLVYDDEL